MSARNSIVIVVVVFVLAYLAAAGLGVYTTGMSFDVAIGIYAGIVLAYVVIVFMRRMLWRHRSWRCNRTGTVRQEKG